MLSGCSSTKAKTLTITKNKTKKTLKYPLSIEPTSYDPATVEDFRTYTTLLQHVYEKLIQYNAKNQITPSLAHTWHISPDQKKYTFNLKKNILTHQMQLLSAEDVKFSIERACSPNFKSPTAESAFAGIKGYNNFKKGFTSSITGIHILDPHTIEFSLHRPDSTFLSKLAYPVASILSKTAPKTEISDIKSMIGTGPFQIQLIEPYIFIKLKSFKYYHGKKQKIKNIHIPIINDLQTYISKFKAKEIDFCELSPDDVKSVSEDSSINHLIKTIPSHSIFYTELSGIAYPPFKNKYVRKAIYHAINLKELENTILKKTHIHLNQYFFLNDIGNENRQYNIKKAKRALCKAGYHDGCCLPCLTIYAPAHRTMAKKIAERLCLHIKTNLNIPCKVGTIPWNLFIQRTSESKLPMALQRYQPNSDHPQCIVKDIIINSENFKRFSKHYHSFTNSIDKMNRTTMKEMYIPEMIKLEKIILDEKLIMPFFCKDDTYLIQPYIDNLEFNFQGFINISQVINNNENTI